MKAVNPFLRRIPEEEHENYVEDYDSIMKRSKDVHVEKLGGWNISLLLRTHYCRGFQRILINI